MGKVCMSDKCHILQIRDVLARGGLDHSSVSTLKHTVEALEADLKLAREEYLSARRARDKGPKPDNSGTLAIALLKRLTGVLLLFYEDSLEDLPRQGAASNYRLVMTRWKERGRSVMRCVHCLAATLCVMVLCNKYCKWHSLYIQVLDCIK